MKNYSKKKEILYTVNDVSDDVDNFDEVGQSNKYADADLNPNHTHFILVDDGSCGAYGKEIEFRAKLEGKLKVVFL